MLCAAAAELVPSEYATFVQRLLNVVKTSMTFVERWADIGPTSRVHWVSVNRKSHFRMIIPSPRTLKESKKKRLFPMVETADKIYGVHTHFNPCMPIRLFYVLSLPNV